MAQLSPPLFQLFSQSDVAFNALFSQSQSQFAADLSYPPYPPLKPMAVCFQLATTSLDMTPANPTLPLTSAARSAPSRQHGSCT
jgi:hypothetical protein